MRPRNKIPDSVDTDVKYYTCFVCNEKSKEKGISLLMAQTAFSRISLGEKLQEILGSKYLVLVSLKDRICWECASYLNWVDKYQHKIDLMIEFFHNQISAKYKKVEICLNEKSDVPEPPQTEIIEKPLPPPPPPPPTQVAAKQTPRVQREIQDELVFKGRRQKEYSCKYCGKEYVSLVSLSMHVQKMHGGKEICNECGMRFETRAKLKRHMRTVHAPPEKELACVSCGFHTNNTEVYCRHVCNSSIVSLTCITCNKRYVDANFRQESGSYQCQSCQAEVGTGLSSVVEGEQEEVQQQEEEQHSPPPPPTPPPPPPPPPLSSHIQEELTGAELVAEMPEFFREPDLTGEDKNDKNTDNGCNSYLRCDGCSEQFKLSDLTQHPCFIRGDPAEYYEVEPPYIPKKPPQDFTALACKNCNFQFPTIEALRIHWENTGHTREVNTPNLEVNKIRDKFKKTEATFKVVKQNFNIRATIPGQNEEALRVGDDYKDMFIRISEKAVDSIDEFMRRDNGKACETCGYAFPTTELLEDHIRNNLCLTCVTCNVSFYDNKLLKKHYLFTGHGNKLRLNDSPPLSPRVEAKTPYGFKCHLCIKMFQSRYLLRKHFQLHYRGTEKGACQFCLTEFENKNDIQQHVLEAHGAHLYKCSHCERTFMSETFRNRHEAKHKAPVECNICNLKFTNQKSLVVHNETYHQGGGGACRLCGKVIEDPLSLRRHERRHYFERGLRCDLCKKQFRSKALLLAHSKLHTSNEVKFQCDECVLGFQSEEALREHHLSHTKPGKYKCNRCSSTFANKAHFWMHLKTHEAPYACTVCNRSFRDTSLLAVHRRRHWRARPYQCPHCHRAFSVPATLRRHIHIHTRAFPHRCGFCKKGFLTRHAYHRHTETVHAVTNTFPPRRPHIPSLPLNATDEDIFQAADNLIDDPIMFHEYPTNKEMDQPPSTDLITNEVVVETTELFDEILH